MPARGTAVFKIKDRSTGALEEVAKVRIESGACPASFGANICTDTAQTRFLPTSAEQVTLEQIKRYLPTNMHGIDYTYDVILKKPYNEHVDNTNLFVNRVKYVSVNETLLDADFATFECYATKRHASEVLEAKRKQDEYFNEAQKIIYYLEGSTLGYFVGIANTVLRNAARIRKRRNRDAECSAALEVFYDAQWNDFEYELGKYKNGKLPWEHLSHVKSKTKCMLEGFDEDKRERTTKAIIDLGDEAGFAMEAMAYILGITDNQANELLKEVQAS